MQASWGARAPLADGTPTIELHVHATLVGLEPRVDDAPTAGRVVVDRQDAGRGTTLLLAVPAGTTGELAVWARCRAGRFTQRGPSLSLRAAVSRPDGPDPGDRS